MLVILCALLSTTDKTLPFIENAITHYSSPDLPPELQNPIFDFVLYVTTWIF